jgi:hypothetical protein
MKVASSSPILRPSAVVASCPAYVSFDHGDLRPRALRRHDLEISTNRAAYNSKHEQALALAASSSAGTLAIWYVLSNNQRLMELGNQYNRYEIEIPGVE